MAELPTGTVTFLFTDIEGSTARWEHQPEAMATALARHDALLRAAVYEHGGHVVKSTGDGFLAAFARASDALAAALNAQQLLQAEPWDHVVPDLGALRVRMALHTGAAEERDGDYYGPALNRAARLVSAGHGGQVLLSQTTYDLARDALPDGTRLLDLGEHRLKDLIRPERVFQLTDSGLPSDFPPLRTLDARPHNLPLQATPLLGREREVVAVRDRLLRDDVRLLTLTGPGGAGKTRLSLHVAAELVDQFGDGTFFVELAPIRDPGLVSATVAQTLGVRDAGGRPVLESLREYLRDRRLLLVLDNFEQVLSAAPVVQELLGASAGLKVLVTSRAPLELRGEHEFAVPPLALPDPKRLPPIQGLSQYAAVALFVERAAAIKADFAVTNENAPAVAEICVRLDGLPLAIELAAARIRLFSPSALLARLEHRLPLLTGGARDLPARQQTLRGAIAWSYDLLDEAERRLFRRLAIFVGGCTLEAAEVVCNAHGDLGTDVLDGTASLIAKSLVRQHDGPDGEPRMGMLETVREYGLEQLDASGEAEQTRRAHTAFFAAFAEEAELGLHGRDQVAWLSRVDAEYDNLRAVLGWTRGRKAPAETGLYLVGYLHWFWGMRGFVREGRDWTEAMLALPGAAERTVARAWALYAASGLWFWQADYASGMAFAGESAAIFKEAGDLQGAGRALARQSIGAMIEPDRRVRRALAEESVSLARAVGDRWGLAFALGQLGAALQAAGELDAAQVLRAESAAIAREIGDRFTLGLALAGLAGVASSRGDFTESITLWREAVVATSELENLWVLPRAVAGLAGAHGRTGHHDRAARLFGIAEAMREAGGTQDTASWRSIVNADTVVVRAALGDDAFAAAWAEGRAMSLDEAVAYALDETALA